MAGIEEKVSRKKVYSEFFTNFAVAWATAGIISPLFAPNVVNNPFVLFLGGVIGAGLSLKFAIMVTEGRQR